MTTTGPTAHQHLLGARGLHLPEANRRRYSLRIDQHASCVVDRAAAQGGRAIAFGPFDLLPTRRLLLKAGQPVRLGSRALDILIALVERPGELVSKGDLMARVYIGGESSALATGERDGTPAATGGASWCSISPTPSSGFAAATAAQLGSSRCPSIVGRRVIDAWPRGPKS